MDMDMVVWVALILAFCSVCLVAEEAWVEEEDVVVVVVLDLVKIAKEKPQIIKTGLLNNENF